MNLKDWIRMLATICLFIIFCYATKWVINNKIKPPIETGTFRISIQTNKCNDTIYIIQEWGGFGDAWINYDVKFICDTLPDHFISKKDALFWMNRQIELNKKIHYTEIGSLK